MASAGDRPTTIPARKLASGTQPDVAYTIATLVTDPAQYDLMRRSFAAGGFDADDCEYLFIDNTGKEQASAYAGLNRALSEARGRYVILCHQDVRLIESGDARNDLDSRLAELHSHDPDWALAGNAGGSAPGQLALRISDPHGSNRHVGELPARVTSLDENFIVVRREANLGFSHDLSGFHFYGTDICLNADILGWHAYVIDFHIWHLSSGNKQTRSFATGKEDIRAKWSKALRPRWIQTTCALLRLDGEPLRQLVGHLLEEPVQKLSRRMPGARGWTVSPSTAGKSSEPGNAGSTDPSPSSRSKPGNDEAA
ncbi:MAG: glycosyltransferase family protein [Alphaproteobacteria bacterium]|nr:glycosyltransferase family protein [Alphaproteobacteria bacterium]